MLGLPIPALTCAWVGGGGGGKGWCWGRAAWQRRRRTSNPRRPCRSGCCVQVWGLAVAVDGAAEEERGMAVSPPPPPGAVSGPSSGLAATCHPPTPGRCFNFHSGRGGGGGSPLDHLPPSPGPPPPSPLHSNSPENQGFGNVFSFGPILPSRAFGALIAGFFGHSTVSFLPSVADTMSQRPISAFFGITVQPCPRVKRDDVVNAILCFRFQDRWTGKKRQEAYNVAQKACSTLFLNTPMALCMSL